MRKHINKKEEPLIYTPTYECAFLDSIKKSVGNNEEECAVEGYKQQAEKVLRYLELYIHECMQDNKSLIIEGIHLTPEFNEKMIGKYGNQCLCFIASVPEWRDYIKRSPISYRKEFARIEAQPHPKNKQNKLVKCMRNIYSIQEHIL